MYDHHKHGHHLHQGHLSHHNHHLVILFSFLIFANNFPNSNATMVFHCASSILGGIFVIVLTIIFIKAIIIQLIGAGHFEGSNNGFLCSGQTHLHLKGAATI